MAVDTTPERPDVGLFEGRPRRPILVYGLIAGLEGAIAGVFAWNRLGWFPPRHAGAVLIGSAILFTAIGLLAGALLPGRMLHAVGVVVVVVALLAPFMLVTSVPGIAQPTEYAVPGAPWLAITASPDGSPDIYLYKGSPDDVVPFGETPEAELFATLSPDRRHVVYASDPDGEYDLFVRDLDENGNPTGDPRIVSALPGDEAGGDWSPDSTKIVFQVTQDLATEIRVVDVSGGPSTVLPAPPRSSGALWSPDGRSIAFAAPRDVRTDDFDIWVMDADGSHAHPIADAGPNDWWPNWSPDGSKIAFSDGSGRYQDAYLVDVDGTHLTRLTDRPGYDAAYGWTPDGSKILISSDRSGTGGRFLYMVDLDGSDVQLALRI